MTLILNNDEIVNKTWNCHLSLLHEEFSPTLKISIISLTQRPKIEYPMLFSFNTGHPILGSSRNNTACSDTASSGREKEMCLCGESSLPRASRILCIYWVRQDCKGLIAFSPGPFLRDAFADER